MYDIYRDRGPWPSASWTLGTWTLDVDVDVDVDEAPKWLFRNYTDVNIALRAHQSLAQPTIYSN